MLKILIPHPLSQKRLPQPLIHNIKIQILRLETILSIHIDISRTDNGPNFNHITEIFLMLDIFLLRVPEETAEGVVLFCGVEVAVAGIWVPDLGVSCCAVSAQDED